jgi:hypothetical protein
MKMKNWIMIIGITIIGILAYFGLMKPKKKSSVSQPKKKATLKKTASSDKITYSRPSVK